MRIEDFPCVRDLAGAFLRAEGSARERVHELVSRCWSAYPEKQRRELSQALLALLQPLLDERLPADDQVPKRCERAVEEWLARARTPGKRGRRGDSAVA